MGVSSRFPNLASLACLSNSKIYQGYVTKPGGHQRFSMKKYFANLLTVLIGLLAISLNNCHQPVPSQETAENETEWMPDEHLRRVVREALELAPDAPLTPEQLENLTQLPAPWHVTARGIRSLKGLAYATKLEVLDLSGNGISDITPLSNLTRLRRLDLSGNEISDITPLSNLTRLQELDLWDNPIQDVTVLYTLRHPNLILRSPAPLPEPGLMPDGLLAERVRWELGLNPSSPFTPEALQGLTKLVIFSGVTDLTGLEHATRLQAVSLVGGEVKDLTPLANFAGLRELSLRNNEISDLTPLANLTKLQRLELWGNQISDSSVLAQLTNLDVLRIQANPIQDITTLRILLENNPKMTIDVGFIGGALSP